MKATKYKVRIEISVLSLDVISSALCDVKEAFCNEIINGKHVAADGDTVKWKTTHKKVKI